MRALFQLFVYTCAKKEYAEKILDILDPQRKLFRYELLPLVFCKLGAWVQRRADSHCCCVACSEIRHGLLQMFPLTFCPCHTMRTVNVSFTCDFSGRHRLYQDDCACVLGHYIKDLSILGRDLKKTVVLDNAPHTYPYNVSLKAVFFDFLWAPLEWLNFSPCANPSTLRRKLIAPIVSTISFFELTVTV